MNLSTALYGVMFYIGVFGSLSMCLCVWVSVSGWVSQSVSQSVLYGILHTEGLRKITGTGASTVTDDMAIETVGWEKKEDEIEIEEEKKQRRR